MIIKNEKSGNYINTTIPIIEDSKNLTEIPVETKEEALIETQPTQPTRELPYPE